MINRKELKKQIDKLKAEKDEILYNQKYYGLQAEYASLAVSDIEFKIACLEDQLDFESRMINFKVLLYGSFIVSMGIFIWLLIFKN